MSKKEIRICNGCGKEVNCIRLKFLNHTEEGFQLGSSSIPFGIIDYGDNGWQLCLDCFDKARKNNFELHVVGRLGDPHVLYDPKKHKPKKTIKVKKKLEVK
jgi:hypothetical protein